MTSSYPTLSKMATRQAFVAYIDKNDVETIVAENVERRNCCQGFDESLAIELSNRLWELPKTTGKGNAFERSAVSIVHQSLNLHPIIAGDEGFWRWLTFANDNELAGLIDWRYPKQENGHARDIYFGLGQMKEGMLAYLWLSADAVFDPSLKDPYSLTQLGDVDIWNSHIVGTDFGSVPQFARAFIRFVCQNDNKPSRKDYRQLAREITRLNASMAFELLDESECIEQINEIWEKRDEWI